MYKKKVRFRSNLVRWHGRTHSDVVQIDADAPPALSSLASQRLAVRPAQSNAGPGALLPSAEVTLKAVKPKALAFKSGFLDNPRPKRATKSRNTAEVQGIFCCIVSHGNILPLLPV